MKAMRIPAAVRLTCCWFVLAAAPVVGGEPTLRDIPYAEAGAQRLKLDLYQPAVRSGPAPWIVWVHGGAWRSGTKDSVPIIKLTEQGFAIASIEYRLSPVAPFPAQVEDIQAAIRFLRAAADEYQLDPQRSAIAGASAGGHLAALVGVMAGGDAPQEDGQSESSDSARVQAIVSFYGASNLQTILAQSTPRGLRVRIPALQLLLGGQPDEKPEVARAASPVAHVDGDDPPLLLIHGDQDPQMPVNQSLELYGAYQQVGAAVHLHIVFGAAHGGEEFYDETRLALVSEFLRNQLAWNAPLDERTSPKP